jgi:hypothetical protein
VVCPSFFVYGCRLTSVWCVLLCAASTAALSICGGVRGATDIPTGGREIRLVRGYDPTQGRNPLR